MLKLFTSTCLASWSHYCLFSAPCRSFCSPCFRLPRYPPLHFALQFGLVLEQESNPDCVTARAFPLRLIGCFRSTSSSLGEARDYSHRNWQLKKKKKELCVTSAQVQQCPEEAEGGLTNADETLMTSQSDKLEESVGRTQEHVFSRRASAASLPSNVIPVQLRLLLLLFHGAETQFPCFQTQQARFAFHDVSWARGLSGVFAGEKDSQPCKLIKWRGSHFGIFSLSLFS